MLETQIKKIVKKYNLDALVIEPTDFYYDHITFSATSLSDFVRLINAFSTLDTKTSDLKFVYRGMSDSCWELIPSLDRQLIKDIREYGLEHKLAVDFRSEIPELFQGTQTNFEKISKMQHFGIPTRLLDFTLNPLVALYFACAEKSSTQGRVVFSQSKINHFDDSCVEAVSSLYLYDDCTGIKVDEWLKPYNISVTDFLFHAFTDVHMCSPTFVKPLYLDERMKAQRSVFLLFHNFIRDVSADIYYNKKEKNDNLQYEQYGDVKKTYVEQIKKPYICSKDTTFFAVDKCSFERLTNLYRKIDMDNFLENIGKAFSNRFILQDYIQPLDMNDIWYNFSSIIVPAKYKKTILKQLADIGIDEAYVYPEAEHVAKRIRNLLC